MCFYESLTLSHAKDFVTIITLSIGAYVALKGLQTWKKQLKGSQNYNLVKSILINLYKYKESLNQFRHPAIWVNEYSKFSFDELSKMNAQEKAYQEKTHAYEKKWSNIIQIKPMLLENLIES